MYSCPAQFSISRAAASGSSMFGADRPAPALVPVVVAVEPVVGLPVVERRCTSPSCASGNAGRIGGRLEDRDVGARLHDQLLERQIRIAARELAVGRERVDAHRVGVRIVGRVVVDLVADPARARSTCCATARECTRPARRVGGSGGRRSRRTARRCARRRAPALADCHRHGGLLAHLLITSTVRPRTAPTVDAVQLGGVAPAQLVALLGAVRCSAPSTR